MEEDRRQREQRRIDEQTKAQLNANAETDNGKIRYICVGKTDRARSGLSLPCLPWTFSFIDVAEDDDDDDEYQPSWVGHVRKRPRRAVLDFDVDELQKSFSSYADYSMLSSQGRSGIFSDFVVKGGGDLSKIPCSKSTMIRYMVKCFFIDSFSDLYKKVCLFICQSICHMLA